MELDNREVGSWVSLLLSRFYERDVYMETMLEIRPLPPFHSFFSNCTVSSNAAIYHVARIEALIFGISVIIRLDLSRFNPCPERSLIIVYLV